MSTPRHSQPAPTKGMRINELPRTRTKSFGYFSFSRKTRRKRAAERAAAEAQPQDAVERKLQLHQKLAAKGKPELPAAAVAREAPMAWPDVSPSRTPDVADAPVVVGSSDPSSPTPTAPAAEETTSVDTTSDAAAMSKRALANGVANGVAAAQAISLKMEPSSLAPEGKLSPEKLAPFSVGSAQETPKQSAVKVVKSGKSAKEVAAQIESEAIVANAAREATKEILKSVKGGQAKAKKGAALATHGKKGAAEVGSENLAPAANVATLWPEASGAKKSIPMSVSTPVKKSSPTQIVEGGSVSFFEGMRVSMAACLESTLKCKPGNAKAAPVC